MQPFATVDETYFPIVRVTFTGHKSTDQNFQVYLNQVKACYRHESPLFLIFDANQAIPPGFSHQKMQAKWIKDNEELIRSLCFGTAYVISDPSIRAVLRVIFSFQKQPVPYQIFQNTADAEAWVKGLILN